MRREKRGRPVVSANSEIELVLCGNGEGKRVLLSPMGIIPFLSLRENVWPRHCTTSAPF